MTADGLPASIEVHGRPGALALRAVVLIGMGLAWPALLVGLAGWRLPSFERPDLVGEAIRGFATLALCVPSALGALAASGALRRAPILVADRDGLRYQLFPALPLAVVPWSHVGEVRVRGIESALGELRLQVHVVDLEAHLASSEHGWLMRMILRLDHAQGIGAISIHGRYVDEDLRAVAADLVLLQQRARTES